MIKFKQVVQFGMSAIAESHSRTLLEFRDLTDVSDEPEERGGTNEGFSPTEFLLASLVACTNVISHKIANRDGVHFEEFTINVRADFNRLGVTLKEEIDVPFPAIHLEINVTTLADEGQMDIIKRDLPKYCPVSKVLEQSGTVVSSEWNISKP